MYVKLYRAQLHGQLPSLSYEYLKTDADLRGYWIVIVSSMEQTYLLRYLNIK
jgi:hypothetical protein